MSAYAEYKHAKTKEEKEMAYIDMIYETKSEYDFERAYYASLDSDSDLDEYEEF